MMAANGSELEQFLEANPDVGAIDLVFPDLSGIIRGKRLSLNHARQLYRGGLQLPASMLLLAVTGSCMDPKGRGVSDGDPDVLIRPVTGSLRLLPWANEPRGQVQVEFLDADGGANLFEPRQILTSIVDRFTGMGLTPVVACELEFSLIDRERDENGAPQRPPSPQSGRRHTSNQLMSLSYLDDFDGYVSDVLSVAREWSLPVTAMNAEYGGDQFEINLNHIDDAVQAADHAVWLKQVTQCIATRHDIRATFMAKPYAETAGNGMHWHISLLDGDGRNVFDDGSDRGSDTLRHAIAGVLETMPEGMALTAPNINSYRRFKPGLFVPVSRSWGYNNRSVALRVPAGAAKDRRVEYRVPGADANPYLALSALLAGVHHGIDNQLQAPQPAAKQPDNAVDAGMPRRLYDALQALDSASVLPEYLGHDYCAVYAEAKRLELDAFLDTISAREFSWYLRPEA